MDNQTCPNCGEGHKHTACSIKTTVSESPSVIAAPLPDCDICHRHQTEPGALKISAPRKIDGLEGMWCQKIHICVRCIKGVIP